MKQITQFQASDGSIFSTEKKCLERDDVIKNVKRIMKPLGKHPKDPMCRFANGDGYLPHNINVVDTLKRELLAYGKEVLKIREDISFGWAGRYFDDSGVSPLYSAWNRLYCIDNDGHEWGQPYYALNPGKGVEQIYTEAE